ANVSYSLYFELGLVFRSITAAIALIVLVVHSRSF
ncbi:MAG: hypothetical protein ACI86M_003772, partial [Saprospiraceae bacterium]